MRTSAIIAAYNEEETLAGVLQALTASPLIDEVIVVSDGSVDATVEIARSFDVRVISLRENRGKGHAMRMGVSHARNDVLFFVDADMLDLSQEHIRSLVEPVMNGECEMNVGVRHRGPIRDFFHLRAHVGPVLSGIRVMRREVFEAVPVMYQERYKIELALNYFAARYGFRQMNTVVFGLGHVIKEKKRGVLGGLTSRWDMSREVFLLHFELYVFQVWRWYPAADLPASDYELFEAD